jgi:glucokinase
MADLTHAIAIDLGGTKLSAAIVDSAGCIHERTKRPVDRGDVAGQIAAAVGELGGAGAIGLIVPGIYFAATGSVWAPNVFGHEEKPLGRDLEALLGVPVTIDSDRAGSVVGEQWLGAARGLTDVIFLAVGTGLGAGIISGGRLLRGAGDIAGAVGWFALDRAPDPAYKQIGCWESKAAGPAIARRAGLPSAERVVAAAQSGDARAKEVLAETARWLGMGIANLVSALNPQMVVLGGGVMQAGDLLLDPIRREMREWAQPIAARQVTIERTQLGEDAGLLGAARLALFPDLAV